MKLDIDSCTGCFACVSKCPKQCIKMEKDRYGFLRPKINESLCINCGVCVATCLNTKKLAENPEQKIYAAKHKCSSVIKSSSSGGVFTALSDVILKNNGVIVGAVYGDNMAVYHKIADNIVDRDQMRGSKYTYSLCSNSIFEDVKKILELDRIVMFTGTPCQCSALKVYLGKDYSNLVLVDILCHGIAAPVLYLDFVNQFSKKRVIYNINFRNCLNTWHTPKTKIIYKDGTTTESEFANSYFQMFVRNYFLRESCYKCNFASFKRVSDITIGDFWGIEANHKEFDNTDGVSLVLVNTLKGERLFSQSLNSLDVLMCKRGDCSHDQLNGLKQGERNKDFVSDYENYGYKYVYKKYIKRPFNIRVREYLYRMKPINALRNLIKK